MDDNSLMPYGKHKGEKLANVPAGYLIYMYDNKKLSPALMKYCEENIEILKIQKRQEEQKKGDEDA